MQWWKRCNTVRRSNEERLVGKVGGHEPPQSLDDSKSCVAVQVQRQQVVTICCSYRQADRILRTEF